MDLRAIDQHWKERARVNSKAAWHFDHLYRASRIGCMLVLDSHILNLLDTNGHECRIGILEFQNTYEFTDWSVLLKVRGTDNQWYSLLVYTLAETGFVYQSGEINHNVLDFDQTHLLLKQYEEWISEKWEIRHVIVQNREGSA